MTHYYDAAVPIRIFVWIIVDVYWVGNLVVLRAININQLVAKYEEILCNEKANLSFQNINA